MITRLDADQVNYLNIGLMMASAVMAMSYPFQTFLFVYAVLGPAHYLTEISWLHDKGYFTKRQYDYLFLLAAAILITVLYLSPRTPAFERTRNITIFVAFASALIFILTKSFYTRLVFIAGAALAGSMMAAASIAFNSVFGVFLPTLIHVFIFTALFILVGAMRGRSVSGILSLVSFIAIATSFFLLPHGSASAPSEYVKGAYGYLTDRGRFTSELIGLNVLIIKGFTRHDFGRPTLSFSDWAAGVNDYLYTSPLALAVMSFIAFAYMYHYLNWFSKTSIIQWHNIPRVRFVAVILVWIVSLGLYGYDYALGLDWLFFLSLTHVFLEFPLNHLTVISIAKESRNIVSGGPPMANAPRKSPGSHRGARSNADR